MNIEKGDLFAVVRGFVLGMSPEEYYMQQGGAGTITQNTDRSHEGRVYEASDVCGPLIAAKCVFSSRDSQEYPKYNSAGKTFSINTNEVEIWPVTKQYLETLKSGVNP